MSTPLRGPEPSPPSVPEAEQAGVQAIAAGDEAAFEAMFQKYNRDLYRFALRLLRSPDEAEDAVQAVFVAIWQSRSGWSVTSTLRAYLFSAVRNRALQQLRNARRRRERTGEVLCFTRSGPEKSLASPEQQVERREFSAALAAALEALAPRCREAFSLTREHGMTYAEAGAIMGISRHTVMVHIGRALASLRKSLGPFLLILVATR